jgi:branched-chain amino acid transport system substrate-binding protein
MRNRRRRKVEIVFVVVLFVTIGMTLPTYAADSLKIGVLVPISGPPAEGGTRMLKSIKIATEEINEAGGVLGKKVELEVWDDEAQVDKGVTGAKKLLLKDKVWALIGGYRSGVTLAQQEVAAEQKRIYMVTDSASNEITDRVKQDYNKYKYTFRSVMNVDQVGELMLPVLTEVVRAKTYFYVAETTVWSRDLAELLRKAAESRGIKRVGYVECDPAAQEFTSELAKIKEANPDVVLCALSGSNDVPFVKQYIGLKVSKPLCFHAADIIFKTDLGEHGNYLICMAYSWKLPLTPKTLPFYEKFTKVHGEPDGWQDMRSYDGMHILIDGIKRAGSLDVEKVIKSLEATDYMGAAGRYVFDDKHQCKWGPGYLEGIIFQRIQGKDMILYPPKVAMGKLAPAPWWR